MRFPLRASRGLAALVATVAAAAVAGADLADPRSAAAAGCRPVALTYHDAGGAYCTRGSGWIRVRLTCAREADGRAPYTTYGGWVWSVLANGEISTSWAYCRSGYMATRAYAERR
jgi:hypothetical protein